MKRPAILDCDYTKREYTLVGTDGKVNHVWAYEDAEGWHGRLMSEPEEGHLPLTWPKGCWSIQAS